jgi:hypothetical protein
LADHGERALPPENLDGRRWRAPLAGRVAAGADAAQLADAAVGVWRDIDEALHPIIGHGGVAALHHRSRVLATTAHPWLATVHPAPAAAVDLPALRAVLVQQTAAQVGAGATAWFEAFRELLGSLIGTSLTERLLASVWAQPAGDPPVQDTSR